MYDHEKNIIVKHLAGSRAYGTNLPGSDYDYRGIFIADKEFILTPFYKVDEFSDGTEEDTKFYEMNNYMKLCLDANPNIMESLWVDQNDVIYHTEYYQMLRDNRESFLSSKVAFTYTGYAHNQFTRMDNHHSWIDRERNGITKLQETIDMCRCRQVKDFIHNNFHDHIINLLDLSDCNDMVRSPMHLAYERLFKDHSIQLLMKNNIAQKYFIKLVHNYMPEKILENTFDISHYNDGYALISYGSNIYAVLERSGSRTLNSNGSLHVSDHSGLSLEEIKQPPCMIVKFNKDEYEKANSQRNNYQTWKTNRNEARAELEKMAGYDCKHAMHTIRLLNTASEILRYGEVLVKRPDVKELLSIRNGDYTYDEITKMYQEKSTEIREVLYNSTTLPKKPDLKKASQVLIDVREMYWYGKQ